MFLSTFITNIYCSMAKTDSRTRLRSRKQITKKQKTKSPPCKEMIRQTIIVLKEAKGTPRDAILNYICRNYNIRNKTTLSRQLSIALKTGVNDGFFRQSKATDNIIRYSIGDTKDLETHNAATKITKREICVKTKASKVTNSKPVQNKMRITQKENEKANKNVSLVKSKESSRSSRCKRRKVSKRETHSICDTAQTETKLRKAKSPNTDTSFTTEEKMEITNE